MKYRNYRNHIYDEGRRVEGYEAHIQLTYVEACTKAETWSFSTLINSEASKFTRPQAIPQAWCKGAYKGAV